MLKKFLSIVCVAALSTAFVGCEPGADAPKPAETTTEATTETDASMPAEDTTVEAPAEGAAAPAAH